MTRQVRKRVVKVFGFATIGIWAVVSVFPIFWIMLASFKSPVDILTGSYFTASFTLEHYMRLFESARTPIARYALNSLIVSVVTTVLTVVLGIAGGYALGRLRPKGTRFYSLYIVIVRGLPPVALVIPLYLFAARSDVLDTHAILIIPYTAITLPLAVWLLQSGFAATVVEFEEAALIDGCTLVSAFVRVTLPLAAPSVAAVAILTFIVPWNDLLLALSLTRDAAATLPVFAVRFRGAEEGIAWGMIGAASTLIVVPVLIATAALHSRLMKSFAGGGTKG